MDDKIGRGEAEAICSVLEWQARQLVGIFAFLAADLAITWPRDIIRITEDASPLCSLMQAKKAEVSDA